MNCRCKYLNESLVKQINLIKNVNIYTLDELICRNESVSTTTNILYVICWFLIGKIMYYFFDNLGSYYFATFDNWYNFDVKHTFKNCTFSRKSEWVIKYWIIFSFSLFHFSSHIIIHWIDYRGVAYTYVKSENIDIRTVIYSDRY